MVSQLLELPSSSTASARPMDSAFRNIARPPMADGSVGLAGNGIEIRHLYKIFGPNPEAYIEPVQQGMSKAELNEEHGHVLGLKDINIRMAPGQIQVIMGLSGSGKSTLIRHINRLIEPTAGEVLVDGEDVIRMSPAELRTFRRRKTAMVFQTFALLPHRTVIDRKSTRLNSSHVAISYAVFCLK